NDIPGKNVVKLILDDQPYLAADVVNHREEPIALIAHRDRARADEARRHVTIDIEPLPPVFTIDDALGKREIVWGADNVFKSYTPRSRTLTSSSRGSTRPGRRSSSTSSRTACSRSPTPRAA